MNSQIVQDQIVLTGDRPTGPLHLGHYVGSLANRLLLQDKYKQFVMIADIQALTDNYEDPDKVSRNVYEVLLDYLAVGIDPAKTAIFLQSQIPEIAELTILYLNLVTVNRLQRNPTVKMEIKQKGFGLHIPAGFLMYPVSQAADITSMRAHYVPVGQDQAPMIEQTNEIVRSFNRIYKTDVLVECQALIPQYARLPGIDGKAKMSKSLGNALYLSDSADQVLKKVRQMYTDPDHVRVEDPGKIEGNMVFMYLDIFCSDKQKVADLKAQYQRGGLGDVVVKNYLSEVLNDFLDPIRERRNYFSQNRELLRDILKKGTCVARERAAVTMDLVRKAMGLTYF